MKKLLNELYEASIQELNAIYSLAKEYDMLNEQSTLDWLDSINEISVRQ